MRGTNAHLLLFLLRYLKGCYSNSFWLNNYTLLVLDKVLTVDSLSCHIALKSETLGHITAMEARSVAQLLPVFLLRRVNISDLGLHGLKLSFVRRA